ncbi:MAG: hypothetical protein CL997_06150 [Euryarchaeota archaeon]|nr:hypothetical protein [Euryarchaeota archaeon]
MSITMYRSSNPVLRTQAFAGQMVGQEQMTVNGTINKILTLFMCILFGALVTWAVAESNPGLAILLTGVGGFGGFIMCLVIVFSRPAQPGTMMGIYAILEGFFLGGFTLIMESMYPGIAMQAGMGTISVFGVMFMIYRFEIIKPTERFMIGVSSAMGAVFLIYLLSFFLGFAGMQIPFLHSSGPGGILISLIFIGIAALMLIVDFAVIETGVKNKAPASMEWWGAFGLTITLIWVYIEMVRLISKLRNN